MRNVELKTVAGRMKAAWVAHPGCAKSFARHDVLVVTDVPDDVTDAQVVELANKTGINTPAKPKEAPTVAFSRLGEGKLVNLVMGRPPVPDAEKRDVQVVTVRMEGADRRAKFRRLGREWLERAVDEAVDPLH